MFKEKSELTSIIDQTNLRPELSQNELEDLVKKCIEYKFCTLFIHPFHLEKAKRFSEGSSLKIGTVVGFPFGANFKEAKILESKLAEERGADEIDIVMNISAFKSGYFSIVEEELREIFEASTSCIHKVIIETGLLSEKEMEVVCNLMNKIKPDFVKTSTGISARGVTVDDIVFLRKNLIPEIKIKASGGIRTLKFVEELVKAGANRIGTSTGFQIVEEWERNFSE
ncbi:deoxyribose-phosphate aldolase [Candidatus Aminicenantes bacterium AC-335-K20]|jgi:deoxyribose-phosphate aldolase|nr:deoxyribose-phosphate aldolase [SCandidatus Aminicenantes bacterium Aminicenantia_JdfR_composite]MCP2597018.1 deoxyribose-phosphate aldolase [Candidatus Aminicenantes bacterium AC-335-G13]MCP2619369.1 deoxyribose-phosphate aldolase [Candidatus Aminicenantes bacterium AC-335-K20]